MRQNRAQVVHFSPDGENGACGVIGPAMRSVSGTRVTCPKCSELGGKAPRDRSEAVIYALVDPRTNQVRYIGRTAVSLRARLNGHLNDRSGGSNKKSRRIVWLDELSACGLLPSIVEIDTVRGSTDDWDAAERFWIAFYAAQGCDLTNQTSLNLAMSTIERPTPKIAGIAKKIDHDGGWLMARFARAS